MIFDQTNGHIMKAKELRIGNLVESPDGFQIVIEIREKVFYTTDFKSSWAEIKPIPLTEEWLEMFGLKLKPNHTAFHIKGMQFEIPSMIGGYHDNEFGLEEESIIELKYVHQLQNLYFALKGEELEIKE